MQPSFEHPALFIFTEPPALSFPPLPLQVLWLQGRSGDLVPQGRQGAGLQGMQAAVVQGHDGRESRLGTGQVSDSM